MIMKHISRIVISLMITASANYIADAQQSSPESNKKDTVNIEKNDNQDGYKDWQKVELGAYLLYVPKDFKLTKKQGVDSTYWEYRSEDINFIIIEGPHAGNPSPTGSSTKSIKYKSLLIDGSTAQMISYKDESRDYKYVRAVSFRPPKWKISRVAIFVDSKNVEGQELAEKIFQSIKFDSTKKSEDINLPKKRNNKK